MAAVQLTNTGDYTISKSGHPIVRSDSLTLYALLAKASTGRLEMWKTHDNGLNWAAIASLTNAGGGTNQAQSMAIDSTGLIRISYINVNTLVVQTFNYVEFNTSGDAFQNDALIVTLNAAAAALYTDIAIGTDRVHVVYSDKTLGMGILRNQVFYTNYNGSTWSTPLNVAGAGTVTIYPSIALEGQSTKKPIIAMNKFVLGDLAGVLIAAIGDAENATSFTIKDPLIALDATTDTAPQIVQNANGDALVTVCGTYSTESSGNILPLRYRHPAASAWASGWTVDFFFDSGVVNYSNAAVMTRGYGKSVSDENILSGSATPSLNRIDNYNKFAGAQFTTYTLTAPSAVPIVKTRWANYWEPALTKVEYLMQISGDIWFDRFNLNIPT